MFAAAARAVAAAMLGDGDCNGGDGRDGGESRSSSRPFPVREGRGNLDRGFLSLSLYREYGNITSQSIILHFKRHTRYSLLSPLYRRERDGLP